MFSLINYSRFIEKRGTFVGRFTPPETPAAPIETTNICNAKYGFCANAITQRKKAPLQIESFKKALDELAAMEAMEVDFNVTIGYPPLLYLGSHSSQSFQKF